MQAKRNRQGRIVAAPDITGQRFGRLLILEQYEKTPKHGWRYRCLCDCGKEKIAPQSNIMSGQTSSCGCYHSERSSFFASKIPDLTGRKVGRLLVLAKHHKPSQSGWKYECICECGTRTIVGQWTLFHEKVQSCGCLNREKTILRCTTHGCSNTAIYHIWSGIIKRCTNPNDGSAFRYFDRGIRVCERWCDENGFVNFMADMGPRPSPRHSVDRIDNDGNYEPGNCRWATPKQQAQNRRKRIVWTSKMPIDKAEALTLAHYQGALSEDLAKQAGMTLGGFNTMLRRVYQYRWEQEQLRKGFKPSFPKVAHLAA